MKTWKSVLFDYEIREWSEKDLYLFQENRYVQQAYKAKKWAFVADVFRLYAVKTFGGIYLDTDVEVRKSFNDFLQHSFFIGSEKNGKFESIGTAVIGAEKENPIISDMLCLYDEISFFKQNGLYDLTPNTIRLVSVLKNYGVQNVYSDQDVIKIGGRATIYPINYFCIDSAESYAVHHFEASWIDDYKFKIKFSFVWGKNKRLVLYRFTKNKRSSIFHYPKNMIKKIFEIDYMRKRKLLLVLEECIDA
jgi:hypothetical protein